MFDAFTANVKRLNGCDLNQKNTEALTVSAEPSSAVLQLIEEKQIAKHSRGATKYLGASLGTDHRQREAYVLAKVRYL